MHNRMFFPTDLYYPLMNSEITGKQFLASTEYFRSQYSQEIDIQEQALEIFNLLEEYRLKENITLVDLYLLSVKVEQCNIEQLQRVFYDIAYSNPVEGVFENLSAFQILRFLSLTRNRFRQVDQIADKINTFCLQHKRELRLSLIFSQQACSILREVTHIETSVFFAAGELLKLDRVNIEIASGIIQNLFDDIEQMREICNIILGIQSPYSGGYSKLSDQQKDNYNQLHAQLKKWEQVFDKLIDMGILYETDGAKICQHLNNLLSVQSVDVIRRAPTELFQDEPYSDSELEKFLLPRPINSTKVKLHNEKFAIDNNGVRSQWR